MEHTDYIRSKGELTPKTLSEATDMRIRFSARVRKIKKSKDFYFLILKVGRYNYQSVYSPSVCDGDFKLISEGACIEAEGVVKKEVRAPLGHEIELIRFSMLSSPKADSGVNGDEPRLDAIYNIRESITSAFCSYMHENGFIRMHTPKLISRNTDKNAFRLKYFDQKAQLAGSLQPYLSICTAYFDRVYEVGSVYRAEKHNSPAYLNEFTCLGFELSFIDSTSDIISVLSEFLKYAVSRLNNSCVGDFETLEAHIPQITHIPCIEFGEAMDILKKRRSQLDLDPTDEMKLCRMAKEKYDSEFIFVTELPAKKRPVYNAESFVLLFRGTEIASGGRRIHDYDVQLKEIAERGKNADDFTVILDTLKRGMPPHGGVAIGLERLVMKLCNLDNIRRTCLFPRDLHRLTP